MSSNADLSGKTAIVTGATGGIGKEIAIGLARMGARVVIGARNLERAEKARADIAAQAGKGEVSVMQVDVANIVSIRAFAKKVDADLDRVDILVNNAGAWFTDRRTSPEGHELTLATNVIGPHLLSTLLLPKLKTSAPSRIVNIVSAFASDYDANDLEWERRKFDGFKAYGQSKQALRMLTFGLAKRLEGTGVTVNAAAPGFVKTDFNQNARGFMATMINISASLFAVSPAKGAATPIWVASAKELETASGKYFDGMKEKPSKFREPDPIADLEKRLDTLIEKGPPAKAA